MCRQFKLTMGFFRTCHPLYLLFLLVSCWYLYFYFQHSYLYFQCLYLSLYFAFNGVPPLVYALFACQLLVFVLYLYFQNLYLSSYFTFNGLPIRVFALIAGWLNCLATSISRKNQNAWKSISFGKYRYFSPGPLSDTYGRKPLIIISLIGFFVLNLVFTINSIWFMELKVEYILFEHSMQNV